MLTPRSLIRYGIFGLPLAFAGLPIYVHVPKFYADVVHLDLSTLGAVLLILRLVDAVIDPLIGWASDRLRNHTRLIMSLAVPILMTGYAALFAPPVWAFAHGILWLCGCLTLVYISFSTLMINYYAMGVSLATVPHDHTRVAGFREGFMLIGVLLASLLPSVLQQHYDIQAAYAIFGLALAPVIIICAAYCLSAQHQTVAHKNDASFSVLHLLRFTNIRWILAIGFCNAVPTAITSTLFLFFTHDILQADRYSGALLALYFMSAACGMPIWSRISRTYGKKRSLLIAMVTAIACFGWAATLGTGDIVPFATICILSGLTLGADSMLLPALLSDALTDKPHATASGFGLWNFTSKLTMAFAAGLVLPLLQDGGYHSGGANSKDALFALSFCYALVPCFIKFGALALLYFSPLERKELRNE